MTFRALFRDAWREIRWFLQRARRGWADCDAWAVDSYVSGVLAGMLERLADAGHGHPPDLTAEEWERWLRERAAALRHYRERRYEAGFDYRAALEAIRPVLDRWGDLWD